MTTPRRCLTMLGFLGPESNLRVIFPKRAVATIVSPTIDHGPGLFSVRAVAFSASNVIAVITRTGRALTFQRYGFEPAAWFRICVKAKLNHELSHLVTL